MAAASSNHHPPLLFTAGSSRRYWVQKFEEIKGRHFGWQYTTLYLPMTIMTLIFACMIVFYAVPATGTSVLLREPLPLHETPNAATPLLCLSGVLYCLFFLQVLQLLADVTTRSANSTQQQEGQDRLPNPLGQKRIAPVIAWIFFLGYMLYDRRSTSTRR